MEEEFELGKDWFGLDQCQARLYTAILRHTVLVMAALAICAVTAALLRARTGTQAPPPGAPGQAPPADPGLIPLTVPEIKRLLAAHSRQPRATRPRRPLGRWRRRHQARARWFHQRARLKPELCPGQLAMCDCRTSEAPPLTAEICGSAGASVRAGASWPP